MHLNKKFLKLICLLENEVSHFNNQKKVQILKMFHMFNNTWWQHLWKMKSWTVKWGNRDDEKRQSYSRMEGKIYHLSHSHHHPPPSLYTISLSYKAPFRSNLQKKSHASHRDRSLFSKYLLNSVVYTACLAILTWKGGCGVGGDGRVRL